MCSSSEPPKKTKKAEKTAENLVDSKYFRKFACENVIDQFLAYLRYEKNRSLLTVQRYEKSLRMFEEYFKTLSEELDWTTVDADIIRGWMEQRMDDGMKATTVNADLASVKTFFRFALARKMVGKDPAYLITGPKKDKPLPVFVKESDMNRLLDEEEWSEKYKDVRARTIIILLYETGMRRAELRGLNDQDIDFEARQLKVTGKRNKQRLIPFGDELAKELEHYVEVRDQSVERQEPEAFFLNKHGMRVTEDQIYQDVKENLSRVTMMKKRSPHVLRHSFATAMLNHDAGLESVRRLLGHESLETTQIYTHTTFEQLRRVYKEAHPRG
jgi:integrase/recombinase XerC